MHEVCTGDTSISTVKQLREFGGYTMPMAMYTDAHSGFVAIITSTSIKISADTGVLSDIQYI